MDMSSDDCHQQKHKVGEEGPAWENKRLFQVSTHCWLAGEGGWAQLEPPLYPFFPFLGSMTLGNSLSLSFLTEAKSKLHLPMSHDSCSRPCAKDSEAACWILGKKDIKRRF